MNRCIAENEWPMKLEMPINLPFNRSTHISCIACDIAIFSAFIIFIRKLGYSSYGIEHSLKTVRLLFAERPVPRCMCIEFFCSFHAVLPPSITTDKYKQNPIFHPTCNCNGGCGRCKLASAGLAMPLAQANMNGKCNNF